MTFRVGQKVVCIRDKSILTQGRRRPKWPAAIAVGGVYTILDIELSLLVSHGEAGLRFEECRVEAYECGWETAFPASCFRPLLERKTDISIFKKMLVPNREVVSS
jgi:hypothetical protein